MLMQRNRVIVFLWRHQEQEVHLSVPCSCGDLQCPATASKRNFHTLTVKFSADNFGGRVQLVEFRMKRGLWNPGSSQFLLRGYEG